MAAERSRQVMAKLSSNTIDKLLWSIALPGFGQILNGQLLKGVLLIVLEFLVNTNSRLNDILISSFLGNTRLAMEQANYHWLMFYPCLYMFALWDACKTAACMQYGPVSFASGAYLGTLGIIFSKNPIGHLLLGPVWMGLIGMSAGLAAGLVIERYGMGKRRTRNNPA